MLWAKLKFLTLRLERFYNNLLMMVLSSVFLAVLLAPLMNQTGKQWTRNLQLICFDFVSEPSTLAYMALQSQKHQNRSECLRQKIQTQQNVE